jgi:hypothetical protein
MRRLPLRCITSICCVAEPGIESSQVCGLMQWRRQRNKGARSFRGLKIFEPGHRDAVPKSRRREVRGAEGAERGGVRGGVSPPRWGKGLGNRPSPENF